MILLKCSHCGHEIEVSDSMGGRVIRCARCGHALATPPAEPFKTEIGLPPIIRPPGAADDAATADHYGGEETLSPKPTARAVTFPFLAPAKEPNELGWLAHYRVLSILGQGGMGIVFEAVDTHLERSVALKVMKPELAQDEAARQRFLREARAMAAVKSDHVVTVYQVGQKNDLPFLAMEFLHGEPLDKWLERRGRPTLAEVLRLGIQVAHGLAAAHERGLIHRDIKPGNIFLETAGSRPPTDDAAPLDPAKLATQPTVIRARPGPDPLPTFRVKILDFGLARVVRDQTHLTHSGLVMGTPNYMAPEQVEGKAVDARGDLFSLGCVLYLLTTGQQAFLGNSSLAILMAVAARDPTPPRDINPDLPPVLADLILKMLAKQPCDRPASAQEVADLLESVASELGVSPLTPSSGSHRIAPINRSAPPAPPSPARRRWLIGLAIASGILLTAFVGWSINARLGGVDQGEIVFGMTGPFTGPSRELGRELSLGIDTCFLDVNEHGGVFGRKLRLICLDDGFDPDRALANTRELVEERKVFALLGNVGTSTAVKTLAYARQKKVLFFAPLSGAHLLRKDPPDRHVFNYRASLEEEIAAVVQYLVDVRQVRPEQIAVLARNDEDGDDGFTGLAQRLKKLGRDAKQILRVGYDRNASTVDKAARLIVGHPEVRAVVMIATYNPAAQFIQKVKDARPDMVFVSVSLVGSEALAESLLQRGPQYAEGVIVSQVVPPINSGATLVLKYEELLQKYHPSERASVTSLEGYIDAAVLVEGLKKAGSHLTTKTLIDALESIHQLDLGTGAEITLRPSEHQASHKVWGVVLDKQGRYEVLDQFK